MSSPQKRITLKLTRATIIEALMALEVCLMDVTTPKAKQAILRAIKQIQKELNS